MEATLGDSPVPYTSLRTDPTNRGPAISFVTLETIVFSSAVDPLFSLSFHRLDTNRRPILYSMAQSR